MNKVKKQIIRLGSLILIGCLLGACSFNQDGGQLPISKTAICLTQDGKIVHSIIEPFDREYYDIGELESTVKEELEEYTAISGAGHAVLNSCSEASGSARIDIAYATAEDFIYFNEGSQLFYGTIKEAEQQGYDLNVEYRKPGNEKIYTASAFSKKEYHILITDQPVDIRSFEKILYYSTSGIYVNGYEIDSTGAEGKTIIIMK